MGAAGSDVVPPDLVDLAQRVGLAGARVAKEHAFGAGGRITDWSGNRLDLNSRGAIMAAANGALHDKLLDILA